MTIEQDINVISAGLADWVQKNGGSIHVAHDVPHMYRLLAGAAGKACLAVLFVGEKPRNETYSDIEGRCDRRYWIAISRGYTLESYAGKSLIEGVAGGKPMFVLLSTLKAAIRKLRFDSNAEPVPYFQGIELLTFEGITLDAYREEIVVGSDDGDILPNPDANVSAT